MLIIDNCSISEYSQTGKKRTSAWSCSRLKHLMPFITLVIIHTVWLYCDIEKNTWARGDMKFIFECLTRWFNVEYADILRVAWYFSEPESKFRSFCPAIVLFAFRLYFCPVLQCNGVLYFARFRDQIW